MTGQTPQWPTEQRTKPPHLAADAAAHTGGWVYEIDGSVVSNPNGYAPAEAIIGGSAFGPDGRPTGENARNPGHGPVADDFTRMETPDHWLGWLPDTPPGRSAASSRQLLLARYQAQCGTG